MSNFDDLEQVRFDKIAGARAAGRDPYPVRFDRTHTAGQIRAAHDGLEAGAETGEMVTIAGRIVLKRGHGKLSFGVLRDDGEDLQIMCQVDVLDEVSYAAWEDTDLGDWVGFTGEVIASKRGELSIRATSVAMLAKAIRPLPEKWHGLKDNDLRFRQRYVDLIVNPEARAVVVTRSKIVREMRAFLDARGFLEVETPMLQPQPGGAIAKPFVTHFNAYDMDVYLRIAPELYLKRLIVGGLDKVYEINRNFRNEGVSPRHNPEFTMLEAYQAFGDYHTMMELMEAMIAHVVSTVLGTTTVTHQGVDIDLSGPFPRRRLIELVSEAVGQELDLDQPLADFRALGAKHGIEVDDAWGVGKIVVELYEKLVEPNLMQPIFVLDFPQETSPLARPHRDDPRFTEHFDLVIGGVEIGPAYSELNDPIDQRERFEAQVRAGAAGDEEAMTLDEDFLRALEHGMPPTGGLGFGIDRFVRLVTDSPNLREVLLFPFMRPEHRDTGPGKDS